MKVAVIGCTHAGTAAAANAAKLYDDAEITVFERNDTISFLSCGIALYVAGVVSDPKGLFYSSPEELAKLGITTRMKHDVIAADLKAKRLTVRNLDTEQVFEETFDKLMITTGSWPILPDIEGKELGNILLCKNYAHAQKIIESIPSARNVAVVGAGYIGVELAEAFRRQGKDVALIDSERRILSRYLDGEFTEIAEKALQENGIRLALGQRVLRFQGEGGAVSAVVTDQETIPADLVILCVGFRPNTGLFTGQVEMLKNGAIVVDEYMRTGAADVFAAGDSCAVKYNPTGVDEYIPLATNAVRMGLLAAKNLKSPTVKYPGTQGTSGIKIFDCHIASTGVTQETAARLNIPCGVSVVRDHYRPEFMPTHEEIFLKVIYETPSRRIIGAQILSKKDLTQSINTLSVCIQNRMTVDELAFTDFFFQPHYNKPWNFLNSAGLNSLL